PPISTPSTNRTALLHSADDRRQRVGDLSHVELAHAAVVLERAHRRPRLRAGPAEQAVAPQNRIVLAERPEAKRGRGGAEQRDDRGPYRGSEVQGRGVV